MIQHHPIPDQVGIGRHQNPVLQKGKRRTGEGHAVGVNEAIRIGVGTVSEVGAVGSMQTTGGGQEGRPAAADRLQNGGAVIRLQPVIGIEKGDQLTAKTDGVNRTDQPGCGSDVAVRAGKTQVISRPRIQLRLGVSISHQHMQAGGGLGQHAGVTLLKQRRVFPVVRRDHRNRWNPAHAVRRASPGSAASSTRYRRSSARGTSG